MKLWLSGTLLFAALSFPVFPCFYEGIADRKATNIENEFLYAFENKYPVKRLEDCLRNFPDINFRKKNVLEGRSALEITLSFQSSTWQDQTVAWLISKGADVNIADAAGYTALMAAAQNASPQTVTKLIQAGAKVKAVDKNNNTALHMVPSGDCKNVPILVRAGAAVNAQGKDGATPLLIAVNHREVECVKYLIAAKADVNLADKDSITPLIEATQKGSNIFVANTAKNRTAIAKMLVEAGADIHAVSPEKATALHFAASTGDLETVRLLLKKGANKAALDAKGRNALYYAEAKKHAAIADLLAK